MKNYLVQYINEEILGTLGDYTPIHALAKLFTVGYGVGVDTPLNEGYLYAMGTKSKVDMYLLEHFKEYIKKDLIDNEKLINIGNLDCSHTSRLNLKFTNNPIVELFNGRTISFEDYYKNYKDFNSMLEHYKNNRLYMDIIWSYMIKYNERSLEVDFDIYDEFKKVYYYYEERLSNLKELDMNRVDDLDYWVEQLHSNNNLYMVTSHFDNISKKEYNLFKINQETDNCLIKYCVLFLKAYVVYYENIVKDNTLIDNYECVETHYCNKLQTVDRIIKILPILKQELDRLEKLL